MIFFQVISCSRCTPLQELFCESEEMSTSQLPWKPAPVQLRVANKDATGVEKGLIPKSEQKVQLQLNVERSWVNTETRFNLMVSTHDQNCGFLNRRAIASSVCCFFYRFPVERMLCSDILNWSCRFYFNSDNQPSGNWG